MQLLGGDPDLGAEPELAAVGERGGGIHHHRGGVDPGDELVGRGQRRVTIASVCPVPCAEMCLIAASRSATTATAMSSDRYSVSKSSAVAGDDTRDVTDQLEHRVVGVQGHAGLAQRGHRGRHERRRRHRRAPAGSRPRCTPTAGGPWS